MQVRQSDITKRKSNISAASWGSSVIPGSMMTWQEWFGLFSKCSVIWSAPEASARKSHLRHTRVRLLEQKKKKKSLSARSHQNKPLYHSKLWCDITKLTATHAEASSLFQTVLLKNCCETCRWEDHHYQKVWSQSSGTVHSFMFSSYLTICCLNAFWQLDLNLHIVHFSDKG